VVSSLIWIKWLTGWGLNSKELGMGGGPSLVHEQEREDIGFWMGSLHRFEHRFERHQKKQSGLDLSLTFKVVVVHGRRKTCLTHGRLKGHVDAFSATNTASACIRYMIKHIHSIAQTPQQKHSTCFQVNWYLIIRFISDSNIKLRYCPSHLPADLT
jgi:hypothetical protein